MKYKKAEVEVVYFGEDEFMTGSGNWDGGYCRNFDHPVRGRCGYVTPCASYSIFETCNAWFECDDYGILSVDMGFYCAFYL